MDLRIEFNEREALRYFGARPGDSQAVAAVGRAYLQLRNEVQPRSVMQRWSCHVVQGTAEQKGRVILEGGMEFVSSGLAKHLEGCSELLLFGATLGSRVDIALRRISIRSIAEGAAAQAVAASLIESYCDAQEVLWKKELPTNYTYRWRFSPGYGDWDLTEQEKIFRLLNCAKSIGLTLTAGGIMAPTKSVTAVIGVDHTGKKAEAHPSGCGHKCSECKNTSCAFRQEES